MEFASVIIVLVTYFIRPQDWIPGLSGFNIVEPLMAVALISMVIRKRGFTGRSLFQTPHDWAMLAYGTYIVLSSPDSFAAFKGMLEFLSFYVVTTQALVSSERIETYMRYWFISVLGVASMAVASEYGLDVTHAQPITHAVPDVPRLVLNTYMFNNPNALGHTSILLIPFVYFFLFWRRPAGKKLGALVAVAIAGYCVYLTRSKGAYIAGFALISIALILGRHRIFQMSILALAVTLGWAAITQLPRMEGLASARQDEAIMGRMLAWEMARTASQQSPTGEGWKQFEAIVTWEGELFPKATHSSFVKIGADLGTYGMFFFLGVLYCCLRSLLSERYENDSDERCRRVFLILILGYVISGWMIDRSYHLEYCLMAAVASALHRRRGVEIGAIDAINTLEEESPKVPFQAWMRQGTTVSIPEEFDSSEAVKVTIREEVLKNRYWKRLNPYDLVATAGLTWSVFWFWDYVLQTF